MCELLGISSLHPVTLEMSLQTLMGHTDLANPDGWGAVFYEKNDAYVFREPRPASLSRLAELLAHSGVESQLVLFHIRKATSGAIELRNTHPFTREVNGQLHSFAFNGDVPGVFDIDLVTNQFLPIGDTDGEYAFCWMLEQLATEDVSGDWTHTASVVKAVGCQLADKGPTNFLYSDSLRLYAFASRRRHHNGEYPPGLYHLSRHCNQQQTANAEIGLQIHSAPVSGQKLVLVASVPLSDEAWVRFEENQLLVVERGQILNCDTEVVVR